MSRPKLDPNSIHKPFKSSVDRDKVSAYDRLTGERASEKSRRLPRYPKRRETFIGECTLTREQYDAAQQAEEQASHS